MKPEVSPEPTLTDLMVAMKDGFAAVDARFDAIDERFAAVDARFDANDAQFESIDGRLDKHERLLVTLVERADTTDARISDLQEDGKKIRKHLFEIEDKLDVLGDVVDKDSLSIVQHEERITVLEARS